MSDLYDRIVSQRGSLERLVARIPGFKGYQDKAARRKADRMLRDFIVGEIDKRVSRMVQIEKLVLDKAGLSYMSKTRSTKDKMQMYQDRLKAAAPGYSAMWAANKIGAEELEKLYSFDENQIRYADKFDKALDALEKAVSSKEGIDDALAALDQLAQEANDAFLLREDVLTNLDKSL
jgi:hypothetical protein